MKYVNYVRVSTRSQGDSGLGLEAQRESIRRFLIANGGEAVAEFTEVETGKRADRPQLLAAIAMCQKHGYKLLVAKLDRLARNLHFITTLQKTKVDFVAADNPHATPFVIHILCAVAEAEAVAISERTKASLAAAKARGKVLGNPRASDAWGKALISIQAGKYDFAAQAMKTIDEIRSTGITSYKRISEYLNLRGISTRRGGRWTASTVRRVLETNQNAPLFENKSIQV